MDMQMPICCGRKMKPVMETARFVEARCDLCNDTVYVKKDDTERPTLVDD